MTRTFALVVLSLVGTMTTTAPSSAQSNPVVGQASGNGWRTASARFEAWLTAVAVHQPGTADAAAQIVASWSTDQIERELFPVIVRYLHLARVQNLHLIYDNKTCAPCKVSARERERLRKVTPQWTRAEEAQIEAFPPPQDLDRLILDGVLLHSDVAMLLPASMQPPPSAPSAGPIILGLPRGVARTGDGQFESMIATGPHWHVARALLHFLTKDAARDPHAREWYSTVSAHFARVRNFAAMSSHLQMARQLFDDDPRTAFAEGWQAEALASALVQEGVRTAVAKLEQEEAKRALAAQKRGERDRDARRRGICELVGCTAGLPFGIKNERLNLLDAETHYSEAVKRDPQFTEAHVRLARVRSRQGKHAEAASTLQRLPDTEDRTVMFYARLFLGAAQEALGKVDEAARAYTSALALFPGSQSAHLAMSALAQRRGDDATAQAHALKALASTNANDYPNDPLQSYSMGRGRQADALWSAWYGEVRVQR